MQSWLIEGVRFCLWPARRLVVWGHRGQLLRSVAVLAIRPFATRSQWLRGLDLVRPMDRPQLTFAASDSMVMRAVYWYGVQGYEGILSTLWERLSARSSSILEVGGNVGLYAVLGGSFAQGRYTVLEPLPQVAEQVRINLGLNNIRGVEVLQAAAIPMLEEQLVQLNVPEEAAGMPVGAHLVVGSEVNRRSTDQILSVQGLPFARLAKDRDLIKIDAEGIEAALLESAADEIERARPTLVIEVLPEATHLAELLGTLARRIGYRLYAVPAYGSDELVRLDPGAFDSHVPAMHRSKDVILTDLDLEALLRA
jgi:FkbM family methyltransferase